MKYHYVKDMKEKGLIRYTYCPTEKMLADMLTKPLNLSGKSAALFKETVL